MKRILLGILVTGAVGGVAMFATNAFFSDTETSTGNSFQAGSLDLKFQVEGQIAEWADVNGNPLFNGQTFPLGDLKPGDKGEKTVRLWVDNNPACAFVSVNVTEDLDNTCTEPEAVDEELNCSLPGGELNDSVNFAVWEDPNCNNTLDANETIAVSGPLTGEKKYSIGELPTAVANAKCYGIAYCFGTWNGTSCDGSLVNNSAQSDSFKADLVINALQKRNQYGDSCPGVGEIVHVTSSTLNFSGTGWAGWSCPAGKKVIGGGTNCTLPLAISQAAKPGVGTYPVYPHYTYTSPEEGWVVQNGGTAQSCNIYVDCL